MTFTPQLDTAVALDNLGLSIFNPNTDPVLGTVPGAATGLKGQDSTTDTYLYNAISPLALLIDNRIVPTGFEYTLNITNALELRPKHWYMHGLMEYPVTPTTSLWPANCELSYIRPDNLGVYGGVNSFGWSIGLATCAAICHAWASIVRMWLMKNYPEAVTQFTGTSPDPAVVGTAAITPYYTQNPPA